MCIIVVVIVLALLTRRLRRKTETLKKQCEEASVALRDCNSYQEMNTMFGFLKERGLEYSYSQLELVGELGEGAFGRVFKARAPGIQRGDFVPTFVAVKSLKDELLTDAFCKEVKTVMEFEDPHIIQLLGVCSEGPEKCMIFEYMDLGSLDELLRRSDPDLQHTVEGGGKREGDEERGTVLVSPSDFLPCSEQVASGIAYLTTQRYVHRDIATRNCLVDHNLVVKIGDFGLSREVNNMDYYRVGSTKAFLPVRWMPPEALLFGKFTTQSDVWSFGVLMWEVYTFGHQPYTGLSNHEVIDAVKNSRFLECPKWCPAAIYSVMRQCWTRSPSRRPTMAAILHQLQHLLQGRGEEGGEVTGYVNLEYSEDVSTEELEESERVAGKVELSQLNHDQMMMNGVYVNDNTVM